MSHASIQISAPDLVAEPIALETPADAAGVLAEHAARTRFADLPPALVAHVEPVGGRDEEPEVRRAHPDELERGLELRGEDRGDDRAPPVRHLAQDGHGHFAAEHEGDDP